MSSAYVRGDDSGGRHYSFRHTRQPVRNDGGTLPIDKETGDEVSSGTVNQFEPFDMKAARTGKDSSIQRMVRLVQSADAGKAKIVRLADRWATWIVAIALVSRQGGPGWPRAN